MGNKGSRFVSGEVRFAIVSIAELYSRTVFVTKGVGGDAASVPGVQHGVAGIFCCRLTGDEEADGLHGSLFGRSMKM